MNPVVSIQARLGSTRLPGKVLYSLGPYRVIEWVVKRCAAVDVVDKVYVSIGDRPENEAIVEWCQRNDVLYSIGPEADLLSRHRQTLTKSAGDPLIRITGDCPFVPPEEIERLISEHRENDAPCTTNVMDKMPVGTAVDVIDTNALEELSEAGETHPTQAMHDAPETWDVVLSSSPTWSSLADAHLAVDTAEDYWRLIDALEAVGTEPIAVARWQVEQTK